MNLVVGKTYISDIFPTRLFTLDYVGARMVVVTDDDHEEHTFTREWFEYNAKEVPTTITVEGYINDNHQSFVAEELCHKWHMATKGLTKVRAVFTIIEE